MAKVKSNISSNKAAGRDLQNWTCEQFSQVLSVDWGTDDDHEIRPRPGSQKGVDIIFSVRLKKLLSSLGFPFSVECKNHKTWDIQKAIFQAKTNSQNGSDWLLVMKKRSQVKKLRIDPVVVMDATIFFNLLRGLYAESKDQENTQEKDT